MSQSMGTRIRRKPERSKWIGEKRKAFAGDEWQSENDASGKAIRVPVFDAVRICIGRSAVGWEEQRVELWNKFEY